MFDLTVLDNSNLARTLGVFLVILIWLFFFRVIRAVWVEVKPPKVRSVGRRPRRCPPGAGAPRVVPSRRSRSGASSCRARG